MSIYYSDDYVTLYHGDCLEHPEWWTGADVLVTDPPYGIGWSHNPISPGRNFGKYYSDLNRPIAGDNNAATRDAALALWAGRPAFVFGSLLLAPPQGTKLVAIYLKPKNAGSRMCFAGIRRDAEAIYVLGFKVAGAAGRSSIFQTAADRVSGGKNGERNAGLVQRYGHPHAKPLDVMEELISLSPGTIADPFAGSGSTLVAAKALGRRAIGVELEGRYCEIAARRLSQEVFDFGALA